MTPEQALARIDSGDADVVALEVESIVDARVDESGDHAAWARVLERCGRGPLAFREWLLAVRDAPNDPDALLGLAQSFRERGEATRAIPLLEQVLDQRTADRVALEALVDLYRANGLETRAKEAIERARSDGFDAARADGLLRAGESAVANSSPDREDKSALPRDEEIVRFLELFRGREDVHARQWYDRRRGVGYAPVHQPLTPKVVRDHLLGDDTIGVYPIRVDGTATFFALDLDIQRRALDAAQSDRDAMQRLRADAADAGLAARTKLRALGFEPLLEDSGYKGRHLWVFLSQPEDAAVLHRLGTLLVPYLGLDLPDGLAYEFFPRQSRRSGKGLGNLIKLPLGIHRRSGQRSRLLDEAGEPVDSGMDALRNVERASRDTLYAALDNLEKKETPREPSNASQRTSRRESSAGPNPLPPRPWSEADFETDPEVSHVLRQCHVLAAMKQKALTERRLTRDEQLVVTYTLGHLTWGVDAVNHLLRRCVDVGPERYLKSRLSGSPMSCPKIRKRIPNVTRRVDCSCPFSFAPDRYPSPTLHLLTLKRDEPAARVSPEEAALRYGLLDERRRQVEREFAELRDELLARIRTTTDRTIQLADGRYELRERGGVEEIVWVPRANA